MSFNIGDKVRFLNDTGGGVVVGFQDNSIVLVETEDGFEMPVLANELIRDKNVLVDKQGNIKEESTTVKKAVPKKEKIKLADYKHEKFKGEVHLAIVPENVELLHVSNFQLYLLNTSNYEFNYVLSSYDSAVATLLKSGTISAGKKLKIKDLSQTEISKIKQFQLQGIFSKTGLFDPQKPVNTIFNISDYSFYKSVTFQKSRFFNFPVLMLGGETSKMEAAIQKLSKSDIARVINEKESKEKKNQASNKVKPVIEEVDLHIESIMENFADLSNGDIVQVQLDRFETSLETAIKSKLAKIVFIHGVGNGKLKHELRKKLDRKYPDFKYQDASFKEYGYGATMVYLK